METIDDYFTDSEEDKINIKWFKEGIRDHIIMKEYKTNNTRKYFTKIGQNIHVMLSCCIEMNSTIPPYGITIDFTVE